MSVNEKTLEVIRNRFRGLLRREPMALGDIKVTYAVLSTPRCGSSMFCNILENTGCLGVPGEWINGVYMGVYREVKGANTFDFSQYVHDVMQRTTTPNGVFGINFHVDQYLALKEQGVDVFDIFPFRRVYYLERRDKVAQAYSLAKAQATGSWASFTDEGTSDVEVDAAAVAQCLSFLIKSDQHVKTALADRVDAIFSYEDFCSGTNGESYRRVLADFDADPQHLVLETPKFRRQSSDNDRAAIEAFKKYILGEV